jgi:hypothetical protein
MKHANDQSRNWRSPLVNAGIRRVVVSQVHELTKGIEHAGTCAVILIVDSSTDRTIEIALESGARLLKAPTARTRTAYVDALPLGKYILIGDADCTYDF